MHARIVAREYQDKVDRIRHPMRDNGREEIASARTAFARRAAGELRDRCPSGDPDDCTWHGDHGRAVDDASSGIRRCSSHRLRVRFEQRCGAHRWAGRDRIAGGRLCRQRRQFVRRFSRRGRRLCFGVGCRRHRRLRTHWAPALKGARVSGSQE